VALPAPAQSAQGPEQPRDLSGESAHLRLKLVEAFGIAACLRHIDGLTIGRRRILLLAAEAEEAPLRRLAGRRSRD